MLLNKIATWPIGNTTNIFDEMERLRRQMDLLVGGLSGELGRESVSGVFPLMNVTEDKDNYYIRAELPGFKADDLEISVTGNTMSISGERKLDVDDENAQYHRREREFGKFSRIITLPTQIDTNKVEAHCEDGVLTVTLPKAEEAKPKQITVKAS